MGKSNHSHPGALLWIRRALGTTFFHFIYMGFTNTVTQTETAGSHLPAVHTGPFQPSGKIGIILAYTTNFHIQWRNGLNTSSGFVLLNEINS